MERDSLYEKRICAYGRKRALATAASQGHPKKRPPATFEKKQREAFFRDSKKRVTASARFVWQGVLQV